MKRNNIVIKFDLMLIALLATLSVLLPRRVDYLSENIGFSITELLLILTVILFIIQTILGLVKMDIYKNILLILGMLIIFALQITLFSYFEMFDNIINIIKNNIIFLSSIYVLYFISEMKSYYKTVYNFLRYIILICIITLCISIIFSISSINLLKAYNINRMLYVNNNFFRATSPFGGPNLIGSLGAFILPMLISLSYLEKGFLKIEYKFFFIISLIAITLSGSKTSFITAILCIMSYLIITRRILKLNFEIVSLFIGTLIALKTTRLADLFKGIQSLNDAGSNRTSVWTNAINLIIKNPFFGWGKDYWLTTKNNIFIEPFHSHNLWLEIILDNGLFIGSAFMCLFLFFIINNFNRALNNNNEIKTGIFVSLFSFLILTLGDYIFWESKALIIYSIIIGLFLNLLNENNKVKDLV